MLLNNKRGKVEATLRGDSLRDSRFSSANPLGCESSIRPECGQSGMTEGGFTLVEVMIAMVLSLIIFLALMQTSLISMEHNTRNALRDEAVGIAGMRMEDARNLSFTNLVDDTASLAGADCPSGFSATGVLVERNVRSVTGFDFCTNREVDTIDSGTRRVTITVGWKWKGQGFTHAVSTVMRG